MQITGMLYGTKLLQFAGFPAAEVLCPDASEEAIKALIERHGSVVVKPVFKGGVGKKGKAGLLGRAKDLKTTLKEKERLYFVEHRHGNQVATSCSRSAIPRADWASASLCSWRGRLCGTGNTSSGFLFERQVHAFVAAVLPGWS